MIEITSEMIIANYADSENGADFIQGTFFNGMFLFAATLNGHEDRVMFRSCNQRELTRCEKSVEDMILAHIKKELNI